MRLFLRCSFRFCRHRCILRALTGLRFFRCLGRILTSIRDLARGLGSVYRFSIWGNLTRLFGLTSCFHGISFISAEVRQTRKGSDI